MKATPLITSPPTHPYIPACYQFTQLLRDEPLVYTRRRDWLEKLSAAAPPTTRDNRERVMQEQFRWWHKGDLDGFFGLFVDNLIQLILIVVLCGAILHMPGEIVYGRILPGVALILLLMIADVHSEHLRI